MRVPARRSPLDTSVKGSPLPTSWRGGESIASYWPAQKEDKWGNFRRILKRRGRSSEFLNLRQLGHLFFHFNTSAGWTPEHTKKSIFHLKTRQWWWKPLHCTWKLRCFNSTNSGNCSFEVSKEQCSSSKNFESILGYTFYWRSNSPFCSPYVQPFPQKFLTFGAHP